MAPRTASVRPVTPPLARQQDPVRDAITAAARRPEPEAVAALLDAATLDEAQRRRAHDLAVDLATKVRATRRDAAGAEAMVQAYSLSSEEGVALMCLAEALLRIPDADTADALIRDKLSRGDWRSHAAMTESLFVNAASWGLLLTGKLMSPAPDAGLLGRALTESLTRLGEPVIRTAMRTAMRFLGEQFVLGETIGAALERAKLREARGFRHSFDMLGEAALTADDAARYHAAYVTAIHAIGEAARGRGVADGPGLSVKLSALHPRYSRSQRDRVREELAPRLAELARLARRYDVGLAIDAEEADRLELSLDLVETLARAPELDGWEGLGVVVQSYQKRAPEVIDWLLALAHDTGRRMTVRLVKGAYWDAEIKRAQVDGHDGYPVFTRKVHTDLAYLACARTLLAHRSLVYPQFATHNAATLAAVLELAGSRTGFEFQCLHGMGEALYDHVTGPGTLGVACRIYAPVGTHETLLAYLVRRLLENGANTSFVHQVADPRIDVAALVADPATAARATRGTPHPRIPLPGNLYPDRRNSRGLDFADERALARLDAALREAATQAYVASPYVDGRASGDATLRPVRSPVDRASTVGYVADASPHDVDGALASACAQGRAWSGQPASERAAVLDRAADLIEENAPRLLHLAVHEAGKTLPNAMGEVREAADFCRYYAAQIRRAPLAPPLGPVVAISPWNFPLAIFVGQIAGALAAGNPVVAKPAEQTPLIAYQAVRLLHAAGVPTAALHLLPGSGEAVGAALVRDARTAAVAFTGSTLAAAHIHRALAERGNVPLIAETGGQNAMIVDASALPEQVVADALASAFDSAGQRCSALRVLCVQDTIADRVVAMLAGAMRELAVGNPASLATDVGPIIDADARRALSAHVARMDREARRIAEAPLDPGIASRGAYFAPVAFEIPSIGVLAGEVFGPVLHVVRWRHGELDALLDAIAATGYALTLGIHSRIDATVDHVIARSRAGNVYVNRNVIGAVVGVQPFGGDGLSGTGPKAGGPLYVPRLTHDPGDVDAREVELPGPTGERNTWSTHPRGHLVALGGGADDARTWRLQADAALQRGNRVTFAPRAAAQVTATGVAEALASSGATIDVLDPSTDWSLLRDLAGALAADPATAAEANRRLAHRPGARLPVVEPAGDPPRYPSARLVIERTVTVNTTAAGGNASLVAAID
ncbi:MAG TPA: bifunctional proline dehydrogenase/L-glutamate gamma-semialdehyde dehydrogenase PutA [Casimicrobiaceae bacterium]|nr:bifunctional proline dehydrogenase/L-glutamate gamma-semialdehyde dehydrogenase PutA [Casimicrobiaceae bacterium]